MAGVPILPMPPARLGIGPRHGDLQPRPAPEAMHGLLVDRPALSIQEGPDPPISVPRVDPGQGLDPSSQRRPFVAKGRLVLTRQII
jgi:hypothetical protein